jgi:hypothetical protein
MVECQGRSPGTFPAECPRQHLGEDDSHGNRGDAGIHEEHAKTDVWRGRRRGEVVGGIGDREEEDRDRDRPQQLSSPVVLASVAVDGL